MKRRRRRRRGADPPDAPSIPHSANDVMADDAAMVAVAVDDATRRMTHIER
jgi:hypothetical protein